MLICTRSVYPEILSSLLFYDYTNTLFLSHHICGISITSEKELRNHWPKVFELEEEKATYKWWRAKLSINCFNETCNNISASSLKFGDESMSAIRFWTTTKGNLTHLFYILIDPDPLEI